MPKPRRYFRYRVTDVWGCMEGRIEVGALTLDRWVGKSYGYSIYDRKAGEITGGYSVKSEGEATPEQYADLRKSGREVPDEKVVAWWVAPDEQPHEPLPVYRTHRRLDVPLASRLPDRRHGPRDASRYACRCPYRDLGGSGLMGCPPMNNPWRRP